MFQLSQKYKSSADLVSELLRKPVFTRYRSIKKKSGCYPVQKPSSEISSKLAVISAENEGSPVPPVEIEHLGSQSGDVEMVEVQLVSPVTLRPRIETVNSGRDYSQSDDSPLADDEAIQAGFEVKQSRCAESNTNKATASNNTNNKTNTNRANSNNADTVTSSSNVSLVEGRGEGEKVETVNDLYVSVSRSVWCL